MAIGLANQKSRLWHVPLKLSKVGMSEELRTVLSCMADIDVGVNANLFNDISVHCVAVAMINLLQVEDEFSLIGSALSTCLLIGSILHSVFFRLFQSIFVVI